MSTASGGKGADGTVAKAKALTYRPLSDYTQGYISRQDIDPCVARVVQEIPREHMVEVLAVNTMHNFNVFDDRLTRLEALSIGRQESAESVTSTPRCGHEKFTGLRCQDFIDGKCNWKLSKHIGLGK